MGVLPKKIQDRIEWFEQRLAGWATHAASIGVLPAQLTEIQERVAAAREGYNAAHAARTTSEMATFGMHTAVRDMSTYGADLIATIKAFAETSGNPKVYELAQVPPPAPPTPAGPPVPPTDLVADPNADGTVTLRWKGSLQNQTFFTVWRKIADGAFVQVGAVAAKAFVDLSVPQGVTRVSYTIRSQRNQQVSAPSAETTVNYGSGGNQGVNALRMAA